VGQAGSPLHVSYEHEQKIAPPLDSTHRPSSPLVHWLSLPQLPGWPPPLLPLSQLPGGAAWRH
jgi:hypothetical protein